MLLPLLVGARRISPSKPFDTAGSVNEALLAGEERMAATADLNPNRGQRRSSLEGITAGTPHRHDMIIGMNLSLHHELQITLQITSSKRGNITVTLTWEQLGPQFID